MESSTDLRNRISRETPAGRFESAPVVEFLNANQGRHGAIVRGMVGAVLRDGTAAEKAAITAIVNRAVAAVAAEAQS